MYPELPKTERLKDAIRGCMREVDEGIFWIKAYTKTGRTPLPDRVKSYLMHVRLASEHLANLAELECAK